MIQGIGNEEMGMGGTYDSTIYGIYQTDNSLICWRIFLSIYIILICMK